jgi:hypothetical protein
MKCTRCGYTRQKNDDHFVPANECPSCGILYEKNAENMTNTFSEEPDASEPPLRSSPVDAESLKKARERVDKRLKENNAARKKDLRHDQTLELARQFATEGIRKRQEQWKKQQAARQKTDKSQSEPATDDTTTPEGEKGELASLHEMTAEAKTNASTTETKAQIDNDETRQTVDNRDSLSAKSSEKNKKRSISNDSEKNAGVVGTDTSELLDMESESNNTIQKSWFVPSREKAGAPSGTAPVSDPDLAAQMQTNDARTLSGMGHQRKRWRWIPGGGLTRLLPFVAWLILVAGISGAILSWTTLTEAEAGMQMQQLDVGNSMNLGLLLGFAYLVTGVLGFAFFWVSSLMSRQLKDIRRLLLLQPVVQGETTITGPAPEESQQTGAD